jgi:hypothetical protein
VTFLEELPVPEWAALVPALPAVPTPLATEVGLSAEGSELLLMVPVGGPEPEELGGVFAGDENL